MSNQLKAKLTQSRRGLVRESLVAHIEKMTKEERVNYALRVEDILESKGK